MMSGCAFKHYHLACIFIETHRVGHIDEKTWLLGNINQTGYFRVNYDLHNWKLIIQQLMINPTVCSNSFLSHSLISTFTLTLNRTAILFESLTNYFYFS